MARGVGAMRYTPRRAPARFLDGDCPSGVLAIYDNGKSFDRYTVFYRDVVEDGRDVWVGYRAMSEHPSSPFGFGIYDQMRRYEMQSYRRYAYRQQVPWSSLPDDVKACVRRDCRELAA